MSHPTRSAPRTAGPLHVRLRLGERDFIEDEAKHLDERGRFGAGLPGVSDGSSLFLRHMLWNRKPVKEGVSRPAIVFDLAFVRS